MWKLEDIVAWKKFNTGQPRHFKVVHISDPNSNYNRYGPYGTRILTDKQKAILKMPKDYPEWELWILRKSQNHTWK